MPMQNYIHWFPGICTMLNGINDDNLILLSIRTDVMQSRGLHKEITFHTKLCSFTSEMNKMKK